MAARLCFATFYLRDIFFGVPVEDVQEVLQFHEVTPVPLACAFLPGVINLRGQILTAMDLKMRLGLTEEAFSGGGMHVVIRCNDGLVSLLVDKIGEVLEIDGELCEIPPKTLKPGVHEVTTLVCKLEEKLLLILDTGKLMQSTGNKALGNGADLLQTPVDAASFN